MKKFVNIVLLVILFIMSVMNCILVRDLEQKTLELTEIYNNEELIIFLDSIEYDTVFVEKTEIIRLPIYHTDTVKQTDTLILVEIDSVDVVVPIELKQFNDTLSNTAISFDLRGYNCKVDNLYVENLKTFVIKENKPKRWGIGVGIGITYVDRFRLVPTIGISYNIYSF